MTSSVTPPQGRSRSDWRHSLVVFEVARTWLYVGDAGGVGGRGFEEVVGTAALAL